MPWPQTGATQYHAQLGLPDKGRAIKGLVVCNNWDLEPLDLLNGLALGCYQPSPEVLIVLYPSISELFLIIMIMHFHKKLYVSYNSTGNLMCNCCSRLSLSFYFYIHSLILYSKKNFNLCIKKIHA